MSGEGARITGGRWNPRMSFAVLYLGTSETTVIAEFHRLAGRQRLAPEQFLPRTLHRYAIDLHSVLDLRERDARADVGLGIADIESDSLGPCQTVGGAAFEIGFEALIAPSATGHGDVLAVFLQRVAAGSSVREDHAEMWEHVPDLRAGD
jgi:RES domain-containing protein